MFIKNPLNRMLTAAALAVSLSSVADLHASSDNEIALVEEHLIPLEGGRNFRDLGGYKTMDGRTVKHGKLFRSGVLHYLTENDYKRLDEFDIKTIVDLRANDERESEPTYWRSGEIRMISWNYEMESGEEGGTLTLFADPSLDGQKAEALMAELYRGMLDEQTPHYAGLFEALTSSDDPLLFHCSAGKDRTGIAAALLLTALGVDRETVIQDYVMSEVVARHFGHQSAAPALTDNSNSRYEWMSAINPAARDALMGTRRAYIESAFDEMTHRYGSVENYLLAELGMDANRIQRLRDHFLE